MRGPDTIHAATNMSTGGVEQRARAAQRAPADVAPRRRAELAGWDPDLARWEDDGGYVTRSFT